MQALIEHAIRVDGDGVVHVSVAGSNEPDDWARVNLRAWPVRIARHVPTPAPGWAHAGFVEAADYLRAEVRKALAGIDQPSIVLSGHSLGAAVATLAGYLLAHDGYHATVTAFGSPRVFWGRAWSHPRLYVMRVIYGRDLVARVPPWWMGYRHVGSVQHIDRTAPVSDLAPALDDHYPQHYGLSWDWWRTP